MKEKQNCVLRPPAGQERKTCQERDDFTLFSYKTVTFDNGKEFTLHENIAKEIECETCFAKPYHSWERGQNKNANGLLRQYFPKNIELLDITVQQVLNAVDKLNSRPKKCLAFQTPYEVFEKLTGVDMRKIMGCALIT